MVFAHIKAASIMLDAQVAETEPVRAPHRSNMPSAKNSTPLPKLGYHVVRLARRHRVAALPQGEPDGAPRRRSPRMHFVRGHWRHFAARAHKTWIAWQLRGDPELGFVDHDYAL